MRNLLLLTAILTIAGCSSKPATTPPQKAGRTLVGQWEVSGDHVPLLQTFTEDGRFTSQAKSELADPNGKKVNAIIVAGGSYKFDGHKLYTTIGEIDVKGTSEAMRQDLIDNSKENLGTSLSAVIEWKSDDKLTAKQSNGRLLLYKRPTPEDLNRWSSEP